jgi:hypothetical protein
MEVQFQSIKDSTGALSRSFVKSISKHFALHNFIETGTFLGNTIASLQTDFDKLISIELSEELYDKARLRFSALSNVELIRGDSAGHLAQALNECSGGNTLVWLDAHYSGGVTAKGSKNTPILQEIENVTRFGTGLIVILIDDLRLFWEVKDGFLHHESVDGYPPANAIVEQLNRRENRYDCFVLLDALLAIPRVCRHSYTVTPVLNACTESRIGMPNAERMLQIESIIGGAQGTERVALCEIPEFMNQQICYGLGGHYFYWRGLIRERTADIFGAQQDFELARASGVRFVARPTAVSSRIVTPSECPKVEIRGKRGPS